MKNAKPSHRMTRGKVVAGTICSVALAASMVPAVALANEADEAPEVGAVSTLSEGPSVPGPGFNDPDADAAYRAMINLLGNGTSSINAGDPVALGVRVFPKDGPSKVGLGTFTFTFDASKVQLTEVRGNPGFVITDQSIDNENGSVTVSFTSGDSEANCTMLFSSKSSASGTAWFVITEAAAGESTLGDFGSTGVAAANFQLYIKAGESPQGSSAFVDRLYANVLGRSADDAGRAVQIQGMKTMGAAQVTYNFFNSEEFANKAKTMADDDIVELVYQTMLGRSADAPGRAMWLGYLNNGMSYCALVAGFAESPEFVELCSGYGLPAGSADALRASLEIRDRNAGVTTFASRMYTKVLGRAPEIAGLNAQCDALINGMPCWQIACNFFESEEYVGKDKSDHEFIADAYQALLGRPGSAAEVDAWVKVKEDKGLSRGDIVRGFCQSDEFEGICVSCGMTSGMR